MSERNAGLVGCIWYGAILAVALGALAARRIRTKLGRLFAALVALTAVFEFPRYIQELRDEDDDSNSSEAYASHLFGLTAYFAAFSCLSFSLHRNKDSRRFRVAVVVANAAFALLSLAAIVLCLREGDLNVFFRSSFYLAFVLIDACKQAVFGAVMFTTGYQKLRAVQDFAQAMPEAAASKVIRKITDLLIAIAIACLCFALRVVMQGLKHNALQRGQRAVGLLELYSLPWDILNDFLPTGLSLLPFLFLLTRRRRRHPENQQGGAAQGASSAAREDIEMAGGHRKAFASFLSRSGGGAADYEYEFDDDDGDFEDAGLEVEGAERATRNSRFSSWSSISGSAHGSKMSDRLSWSLGKDNVSFHDGGVSNHGSSNLGSSNHGSSNHGSSNHGSSNHGSSNHGSSNHGSSNHGSSNHGLTAHGGGGGGGGAEPSLSYRAEALGSGAREGSEGGGGSMAPPTSSEIGTSEESNVAVSELTPL